MYERANVQTLARSNIGSLYMKGIANEYERLYAPICAQFLACKAACRGKVPQKTVHNSAPYVLSVFIIKPFWPFGNKSVCSYILFCVIKIVS